MDGASELSLSRGECHRDHQVSRTRVLIDFLPSGIRALQRHALLAFVDENLNGLDEEQGLDECFINSIAIKSKE